MTVEKPDHYGGKPIPDDAIEIALDEAEKKKLDEAEKKKEDENEEKEAQEKPQGTPLIVEANIDPSDYIQIPNRNIMIAKEETLEGETWENTHYKLAEDGLFMPSPAIFMPYFVNVRDAAKGNLILYDGEGKPIERDEAEDLWEHYSEYESGCVTWLDAKFYREKGKWYSREKGKWKIAYDHKVKIQNGEKSLVSRILDLNCPLERDEKKRFHVYLDFNSQGLPTQKYSDGSFPIIPEEGIWFWPPKDGAVAMFHTHRVRGIVVLNCESDLNEVYSPGVSACAEGTRRDS